MKKDPLPKVKLHPASINHIKKGHPWVTSDSYTSKFPKKMPFLLGMGLKNQPAAILLNDPFHNKVKARVWSNKVDKEGDGFNFEKELEKRVLKSIEFRSKQSFIENRNSYYLIFGEADNLPGLNILILDQSILIQYYSEFWKKFEGPLVKAVAKGLKDYFSQIESFTLWIQERDREQKVKYKKASLPKAKSLPHRNEFIIEEFEVNYSIRFSTYYDFGFYPDMSSIRQEVLDQDLSNKTVLNLFCYTGAFSLYSLKKGASEVHSVDISPKYLDWLEDNLKLNQDLDPNAHFRVQKSAEDALKKFVREEKKFDLIICDPPSSSSDGKKVQQALDSYNHLLPLIETCLNKNGQGIIFLNTHQITWKKFSEKIKSIIKKNNLEDSIKIVKKYSLGDDCPVKNSFPEGNYLKGFLLSKK